MPGKMIDTYNWEAKHKKLKTSLKIQDLGTLV